jgi:hypothetical protein
MNDIEKQNFYSDLKTEFYPSIESYFKWYNGNENLVKSKYFYMYKAFFEFYNDTKKEIERLKKDEAEKPVKIGFQSSLTDGQIQSLFELLKGKYIDKNANSDHFKASLKAAPLPYGFEPVKWLQGKNTLRELLTLISGYKGKTNNQYIPDEAIKRVIPVIFIDRLGKKIALNKPKKGEYSNLYLEIEAITKTL